MTRSLKDYAHTEDETVIREAIASRSDCSEGELMDELNELTRQERAAGRMDNMVMDDIYEKLSPMLSPQQRAKMLEVLARLKA